MLEHGRYDMFHVLSDLGLKRERPESFVHLLQGLCPWEERKAFRWLRSGLPSLRFLLSNIPASETNKRSFIGFHFMELPGGILWLGQRIRKSKSTSELEQLRQILIEVVEVILNYGHGSSLTKFIGGHPNGRMLRYFLVLLGSSLPTYECRLNYLLNSHSLDLFPPNVEYLDNLESSEVNGEVGEVRDAIVGFHQRRKKKKHAADVFVAAICDGASVTDLASLLPDIDGFSLLNGRAEKGAAAELHPPLDFFDPLFGLVLEGANFLETAVVQDRADVVLWLASECPSALCADWPSLPRLAQQCAAKKVISLLSSGDKAPPLLDLVEAKRRALVNLRPLARAWRKLTKK